MSKMLTLVVYMSLLTWVTLMIASMMRARGWTPSGLALAFGNRDNLPPASPMAGRAERAANNTKEAYMMFVALALAVAISGVNSSQADFGAVLFCWARLAYVPIYILGITYVRTAVWALGVAGLVMMALPLVC